MPIVAVRLFPAPVRFSGLSFSYNVSYAIFGGLTPVVLTVWLRTEPDGAGLLRRRPGAARHGAGARRPGQILTRPRRRILSRHDVTKTRKSRSDPDAQLTARNEWKFFAVLPKADRRLAIGWWIVLVLRGVLPAVFAIAMGVLVGAVQRGDSLAGAAGAGRRRRSSCCRCSTPIHQAVERQPRRPHRGLALRPADRGLRAAAGHGPPRGSDADQRPHRGARLRPRHDRPAAVDLDGLHRRRPGRDDRRPRRRPRCCSRYAWWAPLVLGRRVAGDALAAARERGLARPQHRRGARARSATPTTPTAWRSIRRPARSCGCSASPAGRSSASSRGARACTSCSTRRRGCASSR